MEPNSPCPNQLIGLTQAQLNEVMQRHALFRQSLPGGRRAVLAGYDLSGLDLTGADLSHSDLTGSSFLAADLQRLPVRLRDHVSPAISARRTWRRPA